MSQLSPSQELLFLTNKGTPINDRNFSRREWRDCLKNVGIDYEPRRTNPYAMRHTFITHQLENGVPPHKLARITGHQVKVLLEKYACVLDPNEPLKDFL
jgi:integrase